MFPFSDRLNTHEPLSIRHITRRADIPLLPMPGPPMALANIASCEPGLVREVFLCVLCVGEVWFQVAEKKRLLGKICALSDIPTLGVRVVKSACGQKVILIERASPSASAMKLADDALAGKRFARCAVGYLAARFETACFRWRCESHR